MSFKNNAKAFFAAAIFALAAHGLWFPSAAHDEYPGQGGGNGQIGNQPLAAMSRTPCVEGMAGTFPCRNVDLLSFLPLSEIGGGNANDVWGWADPLTGREYAILGRTNGTSFIDITDPERPLYLGNLPPHGAESVWRDIEVYNNHAFIVSEAAGHGLQVFDLTQLRAVASPPATFTETAHYAGFGNAHTVALNAETGFAYAAGTRQGADAGFNNCAGGLHIVNVQNPKAPAFAGCFAGDGYTHDAQCVTYRGPDAAHRGKEICFASNEDTLTIVDVTNKGAPAQLSRTTYPDRGYTHQGWLTEDHAHFLLNDEFDERQRNNNWRTVVWDLSDLDAPQVRGAYFGPSQAIDHNLYVRGRYAFESNYRAGLHVLDLRRVAEAKLNEVAYFDVYPADDAPNFNGTWSNYPFFPSGNVVVSGIEQGLFVLRPNLPPDNAINSDASFFVQQHYLDFFSRQSDAPGLAFWKDQVDSCATDACREVRRINVSAAFFVSVEFEQTGYLVYRFHEAAFNTGERLRFNDFLPDAQRIARGVVVNQGDWQQQLEANKNAYADSFVARPNFLAEFPAEMSASAYVDKLNANAGGVLSPAERDDLINKLNAGQLTRARVLRAVAEDSDLVARERNRAFVLMQYFGYLRRNPDDPPEETRDFTGYNFWLNKLNSFNGDYVRSEMVKAFITSGEYLRRFGP